MRVTPLQRRTLAYLATVDSATPDDLFDVKGATWWMPAKARRELMLRIIANGHATNISTTRRCVYRITLAGRQAIAPPLVCVAWANGQSGALKPETAEALRVRLEGEMGPGTHWVVPT